MAAYQARSSPFWPVRVAQRTLNRSDILRPGKTKRIWFAGPAAVPKAKSRHPGQKAVSTLPHHVSDRAGENLRKVISQIMDLACDAVESTIEAMESRTHVELDVPQLAGDEAELSFELRERRLGEIDKTLQIVELFSKSTAIGNQ